MDRERPEAAAGLPMHWSDVEIDTAEIDTRWATGHPKASAQPGFPANGQVFEVREQRAGGKLLNPHCSAR
jgi:hypothetical protein